MEQDNSGDLAAWMLPWTGEDLRHYARQPPDYMGVKQHMMTIDRRRDCIFTVIHEISSSGGVNTLLLLYARKVLQLIHFIHFFYLISPVPILSIDAPTIHHNATK